jgi:hypothetical protein
VARGERDVHQRAALGHPRLGEAVDGAAHLELDRHAGLGGEGLPDDAIHGVLPVAAPDAHHERVLGVGGGDGAEAQREQGQHDEARKHMHLSYGVRG